MKQEKGHTYMNEQPLPSLCCWSAPLLCLLFVSVESTDSSNRQSMNTMNRRKKCSQSVVCLCVCVFFSLFPCPDDPWTFLLFVIFCMVFFPVCPASSLSCLVHSLYLPSCSALLYKIASFFFPVLFSFSFLLSPILLLFFPPFVLSLLVTPSSSSLPPLPIPTPFPLCFLVSLFSIFTSAFNSFSCYLPMLTN